MQFVFPITGNYNFIFFHFFHFLLTFIYERPLSSIKKNIPGQYNLITELLHNETFSELFEKLIEYAKTNPGLADYFLEEMFEKDDKQNDDGR